MDHTRSKRVLAERMIIAYDDLFKADKNADTKPATQLKGWFRTKTGVGDKVAEKMATTFKSLASYADFSAVTHSPKPQIQEKVPDDKSDNELPPSNNLAGPIGLTYRIEINLPDTTNIDTFRAILRALKEELNL